MSGRSWPGYLADFHRTRAGITERVLARAWHGGTNPYRWLAAAVPADGAVVDVACGSAPLWPLLSPASYVGVDASVAELARARERGAARLMAGSADALPLADRSATTVVCSMALQVVQPLSAAVSEMSRVLSPGGELVATVPVSGPLWWRDHPPVAGLLAALGRRLGYPNDAELRHPGRLLGRYGLRVVDDERRRFGFRLSTPADAEMFCESLYLPGVRDVRYRAARAWLRAMARLHRELPVPIRRVVAIRE